MQSKVFVTKELKDPKAIEHATFLTTQ